jgi:type I restriction enzyme S subunit
MMTVPEKVQQAYGRMREGWRLEKLKFYADVRNSNVDKVVADGEEQIWLCNYTDVYYNDRITSDMEFMQGSATSAEIEKFQLKRGQVLLTKDSEEWDDIGIPALVTENMPDVLCGYHLSVLESGAELDGGFLAWLCRSEPLNDQFKLGANGVTRYGLSQYPMKNAFIAIPPLETQQRIARFLDDKTTRIDALIAKKRALLERLAEKRQALITRAVTKGLNPAAPLKPSGIDWIGDVPRHWDVCAVGQKFKLQRGVDITRDKRVDGDVPVVSSGGIEYFHDKALCSGPGVLVGRKGSAGKLHFLETPYWPHDTTLYVREFRGNLPRFVWYLLHCLDLTSFDTGSANPTVNRNRVHPMQSAWPSTDEQAGIVEFLDQELVRVASMTARVHVSCERLNENRSALITAAVTGQIAGLH